MMGWAISPFWYKWCSGKERFWAEAAAGVTKFHAATGKVGVGCCLIVVVSALLTCDLNLEKINVAINYTGLFFP